MGKSHSSNCARPAGAFLPTIASLPAWQRSAQALSRRHTAKPSPIR